MKDRAREVRTSRGGKGGPEDGDAAVREKIAEMPDADRDLGRRLHELVTSAAPHLVPRLWYGMPAYSKDGKVLCYFQGAHKFKARYATFGFNDVAELDDGDMWPTVFALVSLGPTEEKAIVDLVVRAAG